MIGIHIYRLVAASSFVEFHRNGMNLFLRLNETSFYCTLAVVISQTTSPLWAAIMVLKELTMLSMEL